MKLVAKWIEPISLRLAKSLNWKFVEKITRAGYLLGAPSRSGRTKLDKIGTPTAGSRLSRQDTLGSIVLLAMSAAD